MVVGVVGVHAVLVAAVEHKQELALIRVLAVVVVGVLVLLRNPVILSHAALAVPEQHNV